MFEVKLGGLDILVIGKGEVVVVCEWMCGDLELFGEEFWNVKVWVRFEEGYEFVGMREERRVM